MKRPEPPNGEKKGLNGVMKILREGPELQRQPHTREGREENAKKRTDNRRPKD